MLVRKKVYFNQKFAHPYYSSGNSSNTTPLSYSVEYLTRIIFCESLLGVSHMPYAEGFAHFGQKDEAYAKNTWPAIFVVSIKTQLCGYFYCKDKNPATLLTLLLLALLLRKLSTMGGVVICDSPKR